MFLTHYRAVCRDEADVRRLARLLLAQIEAMATLAQRLRDAPGRHEALKQELLALYQRGVAAHLGEALQAHRVAELLAMAIELNAQGLGIWLDKGATASPGSGA